MDEHDILRELQQQERLLAIYLENLRHFEQQAAKFSQDTVPIHIIHELEEARKNVNQVRSKVRVLQTQLGITQTGMESLEFVLEQVLVDLRKLQHSLQSLSKLDDFLLSFEKKEDDFSHEFLKIQSEFRQMFREDTRRFLEALSVQEVINAQNVHNLRQQKSIDMSRYEIEQIEDGTNAKDNRNPKGDVGFSFDFPLIIEFHDTWLDKIYEIKYSEFLEEGNKNTKLEVYNAQWSKDGTKLYVTVKITSYVMRKDYAFPQPEEYRYRLDIWSLNDYRK